jgi:membrane protein DedA with SNARE-associated domain
LAPLLDHYGYVAIGSFVMLEDFGVPVPGETILIAAAVYAGAGKLNVFAVGLIAVVAAVVGDNIGYAIGRFGGRALVLRFGKYVFLTSERLDKAESFFSRFGGIVVTVARFIEGLRQANGIVAGISEMAWPRFLAFNALGAALWVAVWTSVGYLAGNHITTIYDAITRYSLYVLIALAVAVAALVIRTVVRRRRRTQPAAGNEPSVAAGVIGVTAPEPGVQRGLLHTDSPDESDTRYNNDHHGTGEVVQRETQPKDQNQQPEVEGVPNRPVPPAGDLGLPGPDPGEGQAGGEAAAATEATDDNSET